MPDTRVRYCCMYVLEYCFRYTDQKGISYITFFYIISILILKNVYPILFVTDAHNSKRVGQTFVYVNYLKDSSMPRSFCSKMNIT